MFFKQTISKCVIIAAALTLPTGLVSANVNTSSLQLKTSIQEVNGVREIEAGDYTRGIAKTKANLSKVTVTSLRAPLLNNLCVAYIAQQDFQNAKQACDESVATGQNSDIALNNRAVFHYATGNVQASLDDLLAIKRSRQHKGLIASNLDIVRQNVLISQNN